MKRAAVYLRVSTKKKKQSGEFQQTTENQKMAINVYCIERNIQIVKYYEDRESGSKKADERPGLKLLFEDSKRDLFDTVIFWSIDRLTREGAEELIEYSKTFALHNIDWISLQEPYFNTVPINFKPVFLALRGAMAKEERERIQERVKIGLERAKQQGKRYV